MSARERLADGGPTGESLREELLDLGATPAEGDRLLADLGGLLDLADEVPTPSEELARLLAADTSSAGAARTGTASIDAARRRRARRSGALSGALVLAVSGVGATGLSAAANTLPAPFQEQVSQLSRAYLPFEFPSPTVLERAGQDAPESAGRADGSPRPETSAPSREQVQPQARAEDVVVDLTAPALVVRPQVATSRGEGAAPIDRAAAAPDDRATSDRPERGVRPARSDRPTRSEEPSSQSEPEPAPRASGVTVPPRASVPATVPATPGPAGAEPEKGRPESPGASVRPRLGTTTAVPDLAAPPAGQAERPQGDVAEQEDAQPTAGTPVPAEEPEQPADLAPPPEAPGTPGVAPRPEAPAVAETPAPD